MEKKHSKKLVGYVREWEKAPERSLQLAAIDRYAKQRDADALNILFDSPLKRDALKNALRACRDEGAELVVASLSAIDLDAAKLIQDNGVPFAVCDISDGSAIDVYVAALSNASGRQKATFHKKPESSSQESVQKPRRTTDT